MWDPQHSVVIVNPNAGGKKLAHKLGDIPSWISRELPGAQIQTTQARGHAKQLASDAVGRGAKTIVSFGGDGTHSEIVDGILNTSSAQRIRLGILHAGSGGDFRKLILENQDLSAGCALIREGQSNAIDVGHVSYQTDEGAEESRHFLNITTMGIGGLVDRYVNASSKPLGGQAAYFTSTIRASLGYKPARVRLIVDGKDHGISDINALCICNGRFAGGGMMFAPGAILNDGLFEVIVIRWAPMLPSLPTMLSLYKGNHLRSKLVTALRGREVDVEVLENRAWMDIDGEAPGFGPSHFKIIPNALEVIGLRAEVLAS